MADLNINLANLEFIKCNDNASYNLQFNGNFENAPAFTAATSTNARWIDGNAGGSITNKQYGWAINNLVGTASSRFDTAQSHGGTNSLKISTTAISSRLDVANTRANTAAEIVNAIPVIGGLSYTVTVWVMTSLTSGTSSDGAFLKTVEYNSSTAGTVKNTTKILTTTSWTQYTITSTLAASTNLLQIQPTIVGNTGTATLIMDAWFDDIVVTQTGQQNPTDITISPVVSPGIQDISGPKIWN